MIRRCILIGCLALWMALVTAWADPLPAELTDALPGEARQTLEELDGGVYGADTMLSGLEQLGAKALREFLSLFRGSLGSMVLLLGAVLICGVIEDLHRAAGGEEKRFVPMAGALVIATVSAGSVRSMMGMGLDTLEQLDVFAKALLPTLSAAVAAGGGAVSAGVGQVATVYFTNILLTLIRQVLLPLVYFYVAVAVAEAVVPEHDLSRLRKGIGGVIRHGLTVLLLLFTSFLALINAAGSAADRVAVHLTRSAISAAVPVVGGIISDATESVLAGAGVLKGAVGTYGMLGVLAICLIPFLHLAVQYLLFKLTAFLAATVSTKPLVELIDALGTAFGLVLGMTGACALLLLISVAASVSVVVS